MTLNIETKKNKEKKMSSSKEVKRLLILKYGEVCFIEELRLRSKEDIDKERRIRYKGKRQREICDAITYHHIIERCKGRKINSRERSFTEIY